MKKIKIDRPEISDQDILKHKNFSNILKQVKIPTASGTQMMNIWVVGPTMFAIAALVAVMVYMNPTELASTASSDLDNSEPIEETAHNRAAIKAPFPELDVPYETFAIDNSKDTNIQFSTGSVIAIPANAFKSSDGSEIDNQQVNLKYREFHNPYDLFVSGIPMEYDSAGVNYTFETAGMIDVMAFDGDKELILKEDKSLEVSILSDNADTDFNVYDLDEETGEWSYRGKDIVERIEQFQPKEVVLMNKIDENEDEIFSTRSYQPKAQNPERYAFDLQLNEEQKQWFVNADDVLFEVDQEQSEFDPVYYTVAWEAMKLQVNGEEDFKLQLQKNDKSVDLIVYPVYDEIGFEAAAHEFEDEAAKAKAKKERLLNTRTSKLNDQNNIRNLNDDFLKQNFKPKAFRIFTTRRLGICNIDRPLLPPGKRISPSFLSENQQEIKVKEVYVVEKGKNQLDRFSSSLVDVSINTKAEKVVWALTADNQIAIPNQEDVNRIKKRSPKEQSFQAKTYENVEGLKTLKNMLEGHSEPAEKLRANVKSKTFPNPFVNTVNIELSEEYECVAQLLNAKGQMVDHIQFKSNKMQWNLGNYDSGAYVLVLLIPSEQYRKTFKLIKH